jgi:hypothetical protein
MLFAKSILWTRWRAFTLRSTSTTRDLNCDTRSPLSAGNRRSDTDFFSAVLRGDTAVHSGSTAQVALVLAPLTAWRVSLENP